MALMIIFAVPVFAQGGKTVMKCSMSHDLGQFQSHVRAKQFPVDGVSCKCFYVHGQGNQRFYKQSKQPSELTLSNCAAFCSSNVNDAKAKGASAGIIQYCGQTANWE
jgi:hypothetical protein